MHWSSQVSVALALGWLLRGWLRGRHRDAAGGGDDWQLGVAHHLAGAAACHMLMVCGAPAVAAVYAGLPLAARALLVLVSLVANRVGVH